MFNKGTLIWTVAETILSLLFNWVHGPVAYDLYGLIAYGLHSPIAHGPRRLLQLEDNYIFRLKFGQKLEK